MRTLMVALVLALAGCPGSEENGVPPGQRLVTGVAESIDGNPVGGRVAYQVVAIYAAAGGAGCIEGSIQVGSAAADVPSCAFFGDAFDPGQQGGGIPAQPFQLLIPCDLTVNLIVQKTSSSGAHTPGDPLAILAFLTGDGDGITTLLPRDPMCRATPKLATNTLDLGTFTVPSSHPEGELPVIVLGGPEGGQNPLAIVDTDQDAQANLADPDDDGDGIIDSLDDDADGDGTPDGAQVFELTWLSMD